MSVKNNYYKNKKYNKPKSFENNSAANSTPPTNEFNSYMTNQLSYYYFGLDLFELYQPKD